VVNAAPTVDARLVAALVRLDRPDEPIAETNRRLGRVAEALGLCRPSYEQVRVIIHEIRASKRAPGVGALLLDLAFRTRAPVVVLDDLVLDVLSSPGARGAADDGRRSPPPRALPASGPQENG